MAPCIDEVATARQHHWASVYAHKNSNEVSWFEPEPSLSLAMLDAAGADPSMAIIDVGAGASRLTAALLRRGFTDITALDVAEDALAAARTELGPDAEKITWITADLLTWSPPRRFDIWHDRAVFHFLTSQEQQQRYLATAQAALRPGAKLIIATFADDGPSSAPACPSPATAPHSSSTRSTRTVPQPLNCSTTGAKNTAPPPISFSHSPGSRSRIGGLFV
jgi:SAM-dependent methyltransferase